MVAGDFPETVMTKVDKYVPKSHCLFYTNQAHNDQKSNKSVVKVPKPAENATVE